MFIRTVEADAFATKCYVIATGRGSECVVVDPGMGVADRLEKLLADNGLRPTAVLLTHGHLDHTYSVPSVCRTHRIPVYLHPADFTMLSDPFSGLGSEFGPQFQELLPADWEWDEPHDVLPLQGDNVLELAGLEITVVHTPGHTPGCVMYGLPTDATPKPTYLVGDTIYAGTIGRTDMPGGSRADTLLSLKHKVLSWSDDTILLTGHGDDSTVGRERVVNPFVKQAAEWEEGTPVPIYIPKALRGKTTK